MGWNGRANGSGGGGVAMVIMPACATWTFARTNCRLALCTLNTTPRNVTFASINCSGATRSRSCTTSRSLPCARVMVQLSAPEPGGATRLAGAPSPGRGTAKGSHGVGRHERTMPSSSTQAASKPPALSSAMVVGRGRGNGPVPIQVRRVARTIGAKPPASVTPVTSSRSPGRRLFPIT